MREGSLNLTVTRDTPEGEDDITLDITYTMSGYGIDYAAEYDGVPVSLSSREQDDVFEAIREEELGDGY